jgi:hypothetical protein
MTYEVIRFYSKSEGLRAKTIKKGLTLEEAQAHCNDPEISYTDSENVKRTAILGYWFEGKSKSE